MIHIALHFLVPLGVALLFYSPRWGRAFLVLAATMLVDVDHLLADPVYDPTRCSIGFHPLHTLPAILFYGALFVSPWILRTERWRGATRTAHLVGLGLLIHMALDGLDCVL